MKSQLYFAYGSNMDPTQMANRCPGATLGDTGTLQGSRFLINSRGVATFVPDQSSVVHGVLWEITEDDERALDRYEGVAHGFYHKRFVTVGLADGREVAALTYYADCSGSGASREGYLENILLYGKQHGFPQNYLDELSAWLAR